MDEIKEISDLIYKHYEKDFPDSLIMPIKTLIEKKERAAVEGFIQYVGLKYSKSAITDELDTIVDGTKLLNENMEKYLKEKRK